MITLWECSKCGIRVKEGDPDDSTRFTVARQCTCGEFMDDVTDNSVWVEVMCEGCGKMLEPKIISQPTIGMIKLAKSSAMIVFEYCEDCIPKPVAPMKAAVVTGLITCGIIIGIWVAYF